MVNKRESLSSRLGFILLTAGCAIGLGNIWRFPYVVGQNGGGLFVLLYVFFLVILGFPVLLMELAVGRAGKSIFPLAFKNLQNPQGKFKWQYLSYMFYSGCTVLLMFYTVVVGWLLAYTYFIITQQLINQGVNYPEFFGNFLASPWQQTIFMLIALAITVFIVIGGIEKVLEKSIKIIMFLLFIFMIILFVQSLFLENAMEGVRFFIEPRIQSVGTDKFLTTVYEAMNQAFFTLSLGVGSVAICGSYINKERALTTEAWWIIILDSFVAMSAGVIIFASCASSDISPDAGPSLIFITLPRVFENMSGGLYWGIIFFLFLSVAAISTLIAVFECLVAFGIDCLRWTRPKSTLIFALILAFMSMPCILGFNLWQDFHPLGGKSNILDLEDFIISYNLLPLGSLYTTIFCTQKFGWGKQKFLDEVNSGAGVKLPAIFIVYMKYCLPFIIFSIWLVGIIKYFKIF